jgi:hypothetical protein
VFGRHPVAAVLAGDAQLFELLAIPAAHVMDSSSTLTTINPFLSFRGRI